MEIKQKLGQTKIKQNFSVGGIYDAIGINCLIIDIIDNNVEITNITQIIDIEGRTELLRC